MKIKDRVPVEKPLEEFTGGDVCKINDVYYLVTFPEDHQDEDVLLIDIEDGFCEKFVRTSLAYPVKAEFIVYN